MSSPYGSSRDSDLVRSYAESVLSSQAAASHLTTPANPKGGRRLSVRAFRLMVVVPTGALLGTLFLARGLEEFGTLARALEEFGVRNRLWDFAFWVLIVSLVELLPVPAWRNLQISVALPLFMAVAFLYDPGLAGAIAFLGSWDPREFKREISLLHTLFNRSQAALSVIAASFVFGAVGGRPMDPLWIALFAALLAVVSDYAVNVALVSMDASLMHGIPARAVMKKLRIGNPLEFLVSYIGLGFLGIMLSRLFLDVGAWAVAAFVMPLLLARQMFFRTRALEEATQELQERQAVLRSLSNRMAEERQDERLQIAGYLHDDLAQLLYRMSLRIDISEKHLTSGNEAAVREELLALRSSKEDAVNAVRALIKDLHRTPIGRGGLAEAIGSYCIDVEKDTDARILTSLEQVEMPAPVQLLCFQIAREAIMNAVKHAHPSLIKVYLEAVDDGARIVVEDDGTGFDPDQGSPEGHFGLAMMRERAQAAGGTFSLHSQPGEGTVITAVFPTSWLESAGQDGQSGAADRDARS